MPTFDYFLKDLDEVKVGVIQNLGKFFAVLSEPTRLSHLGLLGEVRAETDNWRFRQMLALQLADFGAVFPPADVRSTLTPLALDLCTDQVRVRVRVRVGVRIRVRVRVRVSSRARPVHRPGGRA